MHKQFIALLRSAFPCFISSHGTRFCPFGLSFGDFAHKKRQNVPVNSHKMTQEDTKWPIPYGDPRRPNEIHPFKKAAVREEDLDPDLKALLSLALGMAGLFTKVKHNRLIFSLLEDGKH